MGLHFDHKSKAGERAMEKGENVLKSLQKKKLKEKPKERQMN